MGSAPEHSNKVTISKEVTQMWGSPTARKGYAYTIVSCVQQHSVFKKQWWSSPKLCPTLATPWTVAHQAPQSMEFSRQGYWSGLPFPYPGDLPDPGRLFTELRGKPLLKSTHLHFKMLKNTLLLKNANDHLSLQQDLPTNNIEGHLSQIRVINTMSPTTNLQVVNFQRCECGAYERRPDGIGGPGKGRREARDSRRRRWQGGFLSLRRRCWVLRCRTT